MRSERDQSQLDTISWVHLSDFHLRAGAEYGRDEVLTALIADLKIFSGRDEPARGAEHVPIDFIFVTGDVAHGGKPEEYVAAEGFLRSVREVTGVPEERVFVVPGNHDVDRHKDVPAFLREAIKGPERFEEYWKSPAGRRALFENKLAAYRAFAERVNSTLRIPEEQPGGFCRRVDRNDRVVTIVGLSSCWLGQGGDEDHARLVTGKHQLYDLAGGVEFKELEGADLRLALMHHPLDWMQRFDGRDLSSLLAERFDLVLRGHMHEGSVEWLVVPGRTLAGIAAGAGYAGSRYRNAYNVVRVTFGAARHVRVWLRAYAPTARTFVKDVELYPDAEDGTWEWHLPGEFRKVLRAPRAAAPAAADPRRYLEKLIEDCEYLDIRGMGARVAERIGLQNVYTRLRVLDETLEKARAAERHRKLAQRGALMTRESVTRSEEDGIWESYETSEERATETYVREVLHKHPHLILVGDPGSGKTTFIRYVALNLARALLGHDPEAAMERIGLRGEPLFPILVRLGPFGQFLQDHPEPGFPDAAPAHFYRYLEYSHRGYDHGLPQGYLGRKVIRGGCMVLLDGLDEVPGRDLRERIGQIVDNVVFEGRRVGNSHVATARIRAYSGKPQLGAAFVRCDLVDFDDEQIGEFVDHWCRALYRASPDEEHTAAAEGANEYARTLLAAIRTHPNVAQLTTNPLMLTVLAVVHWNRKRLPEQRAELYEAAVGYLIESRRPLSRFEPHVRLEALRRIALAMFMHAKGVRRTLGKVDAAVAIRPLLSVTDREALAFLEDESIHSGLLVSRIEGEIEFWHSTFQEYLAALELSTRDDYWGRIRDGGRLFEERWGEVVLLLAGCLRRLGIDNASRFIRSILDLHQEVPDLARAVELVGRILRDIRPYGGDPANETGYDEKLRACLNAFEKGPTSVPEPVRFEIGEALGHSGDPRVGDENENKIVIPRGAFWMGAQSEDPTARGYDPGAFDDESPVHEVKISDFLMDRFPVTVSQYRHFVECRERGYLGRDFWSTEGWAWRERNKRLSPGSWEDQLRHPNRPLIQVTWYEADAYARYKGARLPTEAEWEYAARGKEGRKYPWGNDDPTDQHANFDDRLIAPSPVGIYPLGATPEGVRDLAGNVDEWCSDWYGPYTDGPASDPVGPSTGALRLVRGGSRYSDARRIRAAYRYSRRPGYMRSIIGFRCVWSPAARRTVTGQETAFPGGRSMADRNGFPA